MLAPAYKSFAEFQGFGVKGISSAAVTTVVVGGASYWLVSYFNALNKKKNDISVAKKKEADAKLARGFVDGDDDSGSLGDSQATSLLRSR